MLLGFVLPNTDHLLLDLLSMSRCGASALALEVLPTDESLGLTGVELLTFRLSVLAMSSAAAACVSTRIINSLRPGAGRHAAVVGSGFFSVDDFCLKYK